MPSSGASRKKEPGLVLETGVGIDEYVEPSIDLEVILGACEAHLHKRKTAIRRNIPQPRSLSIALIANVCLV